MAGMSLQTTKIPTPLFIPSLHANREVLIPQHKPRWVRCTNPLTCLPLFRPPFPPRPTTKLRPDPT